jgi:adsorption protein B
MLGYFVVLAVLIYWFIIWYFPDAYHYPPLVERGSWLYYLILADTFFMFVRIFERFLCVRHFYSWGQAFFSIPRFVWGNIINFAATSRAIYLFAKYLVTGKLIAWDKTDHVLPTEEEMRKYRRKLGDLLLEKKYLTVQNLNKALAEQKNRNLPLGAVLLQMGLVKEDDLIQVLGMQLQLKTQEIDSYAVPLEVIRALPRKFAVKYSLFPLEFSNDKLVVAAQNFIPKEHLEILSQQVGKQLELRLTTRSDLAFAIRTGYARLTISEETGLTAHILATILFEHHIVAAEQLKLALKTQRRSYLRLGDILVEQNILTPEVLEQTITEHLSQPQVRLGDFLVQKNLLSPSQLQDALAIQAAKFLKLGDILAHMGLVSDFLREVLKMTEDRLISVDIFKKIIIIARSPHPISEENLNNILAIFDKGKISADLLAELLDKIECGDVSEEVLPRVIADIENSTTSDTGLIQVLSQLEADRSHVTK